MKLRQFIWLLVIVGLLVSPLWVSAQAPDSDGDGVPNTTDPCPTEKASGSVLSSSAFYGCPDGDNDGIVDLQDPCPTQQGLAGGNGCPLQPGDRDADGVPDANDACPDTPARGAIPGGSQYSGCVDVDFDGVADQADACPTSTGDPLNDGCSMTGDRDGDGVLDGDDLCRTTSGPKDNKGCPLTYDRDGDGVLDGDDQCRDQKGTKEALGCPAAGATAVPDRDGDGVPDANDQCPDQLGSSATGGCPTATNVTPTVVSRVRAVLPTNPAGTCMVMPNVANLSVNVRRAPGETQAVIGQIFDTQTYRAIAQGTEADGRVWYQLENGGWVADRVIDKAGICTSLPFAGSTAAPLPGATFTPAATAATSGTVLSAPQVVPATSSQPALPANRLPIGAGSASLVTSLGGQTLPTNGQLLLGADGSYIAYDGQNNPQFYSVGVVQPSSFSFNIPIAPKLLALSPDATRYAMLYTAPEGNLLGVNQVSSTTPPLAWRVEINQAVFNPTATMIVAFFYNGTLAPNGKTVLNFLSTDGSGNDKAVEYDGMVGRAAFNADGTRLAFLTVDHAGQNFINLVDPADPTTLIQKLPTNETNINQYGSGGMAFSPDGARLAVGTADGKLQIWNTQTWTLVSTLQVLADTMLYAVAFDPLGSLIAVGGGIPPIPPDTITRNTVILLLDGTTGTLLSTLTGHSGAVTQLTFSPDGTLLVSASNNGEVKLWGIAAP